MGKEIILFNKELNFNKSHDKTYIIIPFSLNKSFEKLNIEFSYSPENLDKDSSQKLVWNTIEQFIPDKYMKTEVKSMLNKVIICNLLTLSLRYEGKMIGTWHNKCTNQNIIVSKEKSSYGFENFDLVKGKYEIIISLHGSNSDIKSNIKVELF